MLNDAAAASAAAARTWFQPVHLPTYPAQRLALSGRPVRPPPAVVPGYVEHHRHQECADHYNVPPARNQTAPGRANATARQYRREARPRPFPGRPSEPRVDDGDVDGLHGGDPVAAGGGARHEGLHHAGRKGKKEAGDQPTPEAPPTASKAKSKPSTDVHHASRGLPFNAKSVEIGIVSLATTCRSGYGFHL